MLSPPGAFARVVDAAAWRPRARVDDCPRPFRVARRAKSRRLARRRRLRARRRVVRPPPPPPALDRAEPLAPPALPSSGAGPPFSPRAAPPPRAVFGVGEGLATIEPL